MTLPINRTAEEKVTGLNGIAQLCRVCEMGGFEPAVWEQVIELGICDRFILGRSSEGVAVSEVKQFSDDGLNPRVNIRHAVAAVLDTSEQRVLLPDRGKIYRSVGHDIVERSVALVRLTSRSVKAMRVCADAASAFGE
ncbi:MAG: hypothetical protein KDA87_17930 [Planctomycetales bacterium]|nr:hypothetical protein [Planctomycetales bacterium]